MSATLLPNQIETYTGRFVNTKQPEVDSIYLLDIAHALSQQCRYGGHSLLFYSVAEHAVFVSRRLERQGFGRKTQLAGLHHDDSEAYLMDIPRPLKPLLGNIYQKLTARMDEAICKALDLPFGPTMLHDASVANADAWALHVEARTLLRSGGINPSTVDEMPSRVIQPDYWTRGLDPIHAKELFLNRHKELICD